MNQTLVFSLAQLFLVIFLTDTWVNQTIFVCAKKMQPNLCDVAGFYTADIAQATVVCLLWTISEHTPECAQILITQPELTLTAP